jgi:hypothetical protein
VVLKLFIDINKLEENCDLLGIDTIFTQLFHLNNLLSIIKGSAVMLKHTKKILASLFILAGITLFISCQDQTPVATNDGSQMNLSKVSTFVMPAGATFVS